MSYGYCPNASLSALTTPAGTFSYGYDDANRLIGLTNPFGEVFGWTYLDNGWLASQSSPVTYSSYSCNARGFLTDLTNHAWSQNGSVLSEFNGDPAGMYDAVGNLVSLTANVPGASAFSGATSYSYDDCNHLLLEQSTRAGGYANNFVYDSAGNATTLRNTSGRQFNLDNREFGVYIRFERKSRRLQGQRARLRCREQDDFVRLGALGRISRRWAAGVEALRRRQDLLHLRGRGACLRAGFRGKCYRGGYIRPDGPGIPPERKRQHGLHVRSARERGPGARHRRKCPDHPAL